MKLHIILSSMMKSLPIALHPAWDVNHPFVQRIHSVNAPCPTSHLMATYTIRSAIVVSMLVFTLPLFYLIMTPKCKSNNADNSDMTKRSSKVCLLSEKGEYSTVRYIF